MSSSEIQNKTNTDATAKKKKKRMETLPFSFNQGGQIMCDKHGFTLQNFLSSLSNLYLADISVLVFHILYLMFCAYGKPHPSTTAPEQGCGKLFSLDKSNGKVTGVPNHRVKKHFLASKSSARSSLLNLFF